jgi:hypothetical protein
MVAIYTSTSDYKEINRKGKGLGINTLPFKGSKLYCLQIPLLGKVP